MKNNETENKEIKLLTSDEMFRAAQEQYLEDINRPLVRSVDNTLVITPKNKEIIRELHQKLKEAFFCGQSEAAYYLAQFYYNGWSVEKDMIKGDFIISIGKKCGDQHCMVSNYKNDDFLSESLKILAVKCTEVIKSSKSKYQSNITGEIKKEAEFAIFECIKDTEIKNIFDITSNTQQNVPNTPELLMQPDTLLELSEPLNKPDKKDSLSLLVLLSGEKPNDNDSQKFVFSQQNTELDNEQQIKEPPLITPDIVDAFQQTEFNTEQQTDTPVLGENTENNNKCFVAKKCLVQ